MTSLRLKESGGKDTLLFWRACLKNTVSETAFKKDLLPLRARHSAVLLYCVAGVALFSIVPDLLTLGHDPVKVFFNSWLSLLFAVFSLFTAIIIQRVKTPSSWTRVITIWWSMAFLVVCLGNLSYPPEAQLYIVFDILLPVAVYLLFPIGLWSQAGLAWAFTLIDLLIFNIYHPTVAGSESAFVLFAFLTAHLVGMISCWQMHTLSRISYLHKQEEQHQRLQAQELLAEVQFLRGILPICAYCKQIRDDKGYWHEVENYFKEHIDADFTHGICPSCLEKNFPKEFIQMQKNQSN